VPVLSRGREKTSNILYYTCKLPFFQLNN